MKKKLKALADKLAHTNQVKYKIVDLTTSDDLADVAKTLAADKRQVSALINSAGIVPVGGIMDVDEEQWIDTLQTGLLATVRMVKSFVPLMKNHGGSIVIVNGVFCIQPDPNFVVNAANNGALRNLAKAISRDLSQYNIRVNSVLPGVTKTPIYKNISQKFDTSAVALLADMAATNPLQRVASPKDVAHAVAYLCSGQASYINGAELVIDGGAALAMG